jgi:hypothetical protein
VLAAKHLDKGDDIESQYYKYRDNIIKNEKGMNSGCMRWYSFFYNCCKCCYSDELSKKIEDNKKLRFTNLVLCEMKGIQENTYEYYFEKKIKEGKIEDIINQEYNINVNSIDDETEKTNMRILSDLTDIMSREDLETVYLQYEL